MELAKVKYNNDYLVLCAPDGEIIPEQINMVLNNEVGVRKVATVTITLLADISNIGEPCNNEDSYSYKIDKLERELQEVHKSAKFWENLYERESAKKWYQKLFNL